jgi:hypothetical protein
VPVVRFEWDEANEAHVGRRMDRDALEWAMTKGRPLLLAFQVVIYTIRSARLRPVTTFPAKPALAQMYREKRA